MKPQVYKRLIMSFLITGMALSLWCQSMPDSLLSYLETAARNNPSVLQKFNEYQAALQKVPQVGGLSDPELSVGYFLKPMELVNGNQVADFRLMQMFPWFGVLKSAKDEMSLMANAKFELFRDAKLQVYYEIQRSWYELYKLQKSISISEKNMEILKTIERLAIARYKSGSSSATGNAGGNTTGTGSSSQSYGSESSGMNGMSRTTGGSATTTTNQSSQSMQSGSMGSSTGMSGLADLYRIQMEMGELQNNIAMLKSRHNTEVALFNSYLNRPPATPVFVPDSLNADTPGLALIVLNDSTLSDNPMLGMLEFEKQSIEARERMAKNMGYPMVGLGINYSLISENEMSASSMNGKDMIMPMVTVSLPIYRKKYKALVTEAEMMKASVSNSYDATTNSLETKYYQAIQQYEDAQRRISLYDNQYLLASKSFDLLLRGFASSESSLTDLLRIRQQTLDYELKHAEAIADFNVAIALIKRLMASSQIY